MGMIVIKGVADEGPFYFKDEHEWANIPMDSTRTMVVRRLGGAVELAVQDRKKIDNRVGTAYDELMTRLFGSVPSNPGEFSVEREEYTRKMLEVQKRYGLTQGDPDFLEWMLTLIGRSPVLTEGGEVVYDNTAETDEGPALG